MAVETPNPPSTAPRRRRVRFAGRPRAADAAIASVWDNFRHDRRLLPIVLIALVGFVFATGAGYLLSRVNPRAIAAMAWLYLLVVVPVTLRAGRGAGLIAVALSGVLIAIFVSPPYASPAMQDGEDLSLLLISLAGMALIVVLVDAINRERQRREQLYIQEMAARADADAARERLTFLAGASAALAASLDPETTIQNLTRLMVPVLGDYCIIDTVEEDNTLRRAAVAVVDPSLADLAEALKGDPPHVDDPRSAVARVLRSGEAELQAELGPTPREIALPDARHRALVRRLRPTSRIVVPLTTHGRVVGVLQVGVVRQRLQYVQADLSLVKGLASRAALALDNARLYRQAQDALQARDEFLAGVSHDLKTPLTAIKGLAQLIQRRLLRVDNPEVARLAEMLGGIDGSVKRMEAMIGELLDLTRQQSGRPLDLRLQDTDLVALVRDAVTEHQRATTGHRIRFVTGETAIVGRWDAVRLDRVIDNLLSNAVKYSDAGTITLTLLLERDGDTNVAVLSVQDEGVGIPSEDLPHVFDRFHRGANIRDRTTGSGIGLAGARRIVEQHGGTIAVTSAEGRGSTFVVRLPVAEAVSSGQWAVEEGEGKRLQVSPKGEEGRR